jgi:hypothetical protein
MVPEVVRVEAGYSSDAELSAMFNPRAVTGLPRPGGDRANVSVRDAVQAFPISGLISTPHGDGWPRLGRRPGPR